MDRSHRLTCGHKTKTSAKASPIDCAQKIASAAGLTAKTSAGQPAPVKTYRIQANESDFNFLRKMADLEGYLFYVDGSELHFERPTISSNSGGTPFAKSEMGFGSSRRIAVSVVIADHYLFVSDVDALL